VICYRCQKHGHIAQYCRTNVETKREYVPVGETRPMLTVTRMQGGGSNGYDSEASRGSVRSTGSNRSRGSNSSFRGNRGQVRFKNRGSSGLQTSSSSEDQGGTRRSKEEILEAVRNASTGSSGNPGSGGGNPPNSGYGSGYRQGKSPARLAMMQEAHPNSPESVKKTKVKRPLKLGNQIGLKVEKLWINLESRLPFAHYRIQDELLRLKVCRMKTKGLRNVGREPMGDFKERLMKLDIRKLNR
jgi:hypothetical protein